MRREYFVRTKVKPKLITMKKKGGYHLQRFSFCINRKNRSAATVIIVNRVRRIAGILAKFLIVSAVFNSFSLYDCKTA
jgi:hypothetical protein